MKTYHFYAGMHRSGGTVLATILSQNPSVHVTSNTALYDVLYAANKAWNSASTVISHPIPEQIANMNKAIVGSMWEHVSKPIIIDRNRDWAHSMTVSSEWFGEDIKAIATIRDIPSIMTSWVTLYKKEQLIQTEEDIERLTDHMWVSYTKEFMDSFIKMKNDAGDRVFLFEYDDIISDPRKYLSRVEDFLGLPKFKYDLENIQGEFQDKNITIDGPKGLHKIRPKFQKVSLSPEEELGTKLYKKYCKLDDEFRINLGLRTKTVTETVIIR